MKKQFAFKKVLALLLTLVLLLCAVPSQILIFAEEATTDVIIADGDNDVVLRATEKSQAYVKGGDYSLKATTSNDGFFASQYYWDSTERYGSVDISSIIGDSKSGSLRFWLYIEDISTLDEFKMLASSSFVRFGTKIKKQDGTAEASPEKARYYNWKSWVDQITGNGWNEIVLNFSDSTLAGDTSCAIDHTKMDYFVISFANLGKSVVLYLDDIKVSSNTATTPVPADVVLVDDEADEIIGLTTISDVQAKVGSKSLFTPTNNTAIAYAGFWGAEAISPKNIVDVTSNGKDGALRFWFYIEDVSSLDRIKLLDEKGKYSLVKIGSGNGPDADMYQWAHWLDQVTRNGWNEVILKFSDAWKQGTPNFSEIDTLYFKFGDGSPALNVYIDDIRVSANTNPSTEVNLPIYLSNGTKATTGAKTLQINGFNAVNASKIADPYLKIEIYIARGDDATADVNGFLKNSLIELNSSGTIDSNEVQWRWENGLRLEPGWNVRYLPLSQAKMTGTFDITNIKGFRYYQNVSDTSVAFQLKVKNLSIVPHTDVPEYNLDINASKSGVTGLQNISKEFNKTNTHGYVEGIGSIDASNLVNPHLKLSVYIARDDDAASIAGMLSKYQVELSSAGKCDASEINWFWGDYDIKAGWNTLYLPFSEANYNDGTTGKFDISNINYLRIYQLPSDTSVAYTIKVKDVSIIDCEIEKIIGDVNNDTEVNGNDLVLLRRVLLGVASETSNSDVNVDAYVDVLDLIRLKKKLVSIVS